MRRRRQRCRVGVVVAAVAAVAAVTAAVNLQQQQQQQEQAGVVLDGWGERWARNDGCNRRTGTSWRWLLLLLLRVVGVVQWAAMVHTSEGGFASLVAFAACLYEEDIEFLIMGTLAVKLSSLCLDDGEILFECVEDLTIADMLLAEDGLVLVSALLVVVLSKLTSESHGCGVLWGGNKGGGVVVQRRQRRAEGGGYGGGNRRSRARGRRQLIVMGNGMGLWGCGGGGRGKEVAGRAEEMDGTEVVLL